VGDAEGIKPGYFRMKTLRQPMPEKAGGEANFRNMHILAQS
jgi:hypothetical protein